MLCSSCKKNVKAKENFVVFDCPACGEVEIVRCETCRTLGNKYRCPNCKFEGP